MPIYEYECLKCGDVGEFMVGMGRNTDELICKGCGGRKLQKLLSASNFAVGSTGLKSPVDMDMLRAGCQGCDAMPNGCGPKAFPGRAGFCGEN
jgi:putative FmdB family regulatory protein